jgi:hypothetical protein
MTEQLQSVCVPLLEAFTTAEELCSATRAAIR